MAQSYYKSGKLTFVIEKCIQTIPQAPYSQSVCSSILLPGQQGVSQQANKLDYIFICYLQGKLQLHQLTDPLLIHQLINFSYYIKIHYQNNTGNIISESCRYLYSYFEHQIQMIINLYRHLICYNVYLTNITQVLTQLLILFLLLNKSFCLLLYLIIICQIQYSLHIFFNSIIFQQYSVYMKQEIVICKNMTTKDKKHTLIGMHSQNAYLCEQDKVIGRFTQTSTSFPKSKTTIRPINLLNNKRDYSNSKFYPSSPTSKRKTQKSKSKPVLKTKSDQHLPKNYENNLDQEDKLKYSTSGKVKIKNQSKKRLQFNSRQSDLTIQTPKVQKNIQKLIHQSIETLTQSKENENKRKYLEQEMARKQQQHLQKYNQEVRLNNQQRIKSQEFRPKVPWGVDERAHESPQTSGEPQISRLNKIKARERTRLLGRKRIGIEYTFSPRIKNKQIKSYDFPLDENPLVKKKSDPSVRRFMLKKKKELQHRQVQKEQIDAIQETNRNDNLKKLYRKTLRLIKRQSKRNKHSIKAKFQSPKPANVAKSADFAQHFPYYNAQSVNFLINPNINNESDSQLDTNQLNQLRQRIEKLRQEYLEDNSLSQYDQEELPQEENKSQEILQQKKRFLQQKLENLQTRVSNTREIFNELTEESFEQSNAAITIQRWFRNIRNSRSTGKINPLTISAVENKSEYSILTAFMKPGERFPENHQNFMIYEGSLELSPNSINHRNENSYSPFQMNEQTDSVDQAEEEKSEQWQNMLDAQYGEGISSLVNKFKNTLDEHYENIGQIYTENNRNVQQHLQDLQTNSDDSLLKTDEESQKSFMSGIAVPDTSDNGDQYLMNDLPHSHEVSENVQTESLLNRSLDQYEIQEGDNYTSTSERSNNQLSQDENQEYEINTGPISPVSEKSGYYEEFDRLEDILDRYIQKNPEDQYIERDIIMKLSQEDSNSYQDQQENYSCDEYESESQDQFQTNQNILSSQSSDKSIQWQILDISVKEVDIFQKPVLGLHIQEEIIEDLSGSDIDEVPIQGILADIGGSYDSDNLVQSDELKQILIKYEVRYQNNTDSESDRMNYMIKRPSAPALDTPPQRTPETDEEIMGPEQHSFDEDELPSRQKFPSLDELMSHEHTKSMPHNFNTIERRPQVFQPLFDIDINNPFQINRIIEEILEQEIEEYYEESREKPIPEVDPSEQFIEEYISVMLELVRRDEAAFLDMYNSPLPRDPVSWLETLQSFEIGSIKNVISLEIILPSEYNDEAQFYFAGNDYPCRKLYCQMLFDVVNEALNYLRPYSIIGEPTIWSSRDRVVYGEDDIDKIFARVAVYLRKWSRIRGGIFPVVHGDGSKISEVRLQEFREEKLSNLLCNDVVEENPTWTFYEDEETQVNLDVADNILEHLLDESLNLLNSFQVNQEKQYNNIKPNVINQFDHPSSLP